MRAPRTPLSPRQFMAALAAVLLLAAALLGWLALRFLAAERHAAAATASYERQIALTRDIQTAWHRGVAHDLLNGDAAGALDLVQRFRKSATELAAAQPEFNAEFARFAEDVGNSRLRVAGQRGGDTERIERAEFGRLSAALDLISARVEMRARESLAAATARARTDKLQLALPALAVLLLAGVLTAWLGRRALGGPVRVADRHRHYRDLYDAQSDGIVIFDQTGFLDCNRAALQMFQIDTVEEFLKKNPDQLGPPTQRFGIPSDQYSREHMQKAMSRGHYSFSWMGRRTDGSLFPTEIVLTNVNLDGREVTMAVVRDLLQHKSAEQKLRADVDSAQHAMRVKSEFVANVSHELRTPLNGILGVIGLLGDTKLSREQKEYLGIVRNSAQALLGIINDILDFSKIEAGQMSLEIIEFDLQEFIEEVADLFAERAQGKGLEMLCDLQPGMPSRVRGDPGRLRQVLSNLLGNAIKFTEKGEVALIVRHGALTEISARYDFAIKDTGIGIDPQAHRRLFKAFSQAEASTTRRYGGTGLGLVISKQLAELMGGRIEFDSVPGQGSTFRFSLSLPLAPAAPAAPEPLPSLKGERVLIIEGSEATAALLKRWLTHWGARAEGATSLEQGLKMLAAFRSLQEPVDVLLLDCTMPDLDPALYAHAVHARSTANVKVILLTTMAARYHEGDPLPPGVAAALTKPVRPQRLYQALVEPARAQIPAADPVSAAEAVGRRGRVLVAEDNLVNRRVVSYMLEKLNFELVIAKNGREALDWMRRYPFDAVLMDCQMPELSGFEATVAYRRHEEDNGGQRLPIIAMTANAQPSDREACLAQGMDDFIAKPITLETLSEVLARWLPGQGGPQPAPVGGATPAAEPSPEPPPPPRPAPAGGAPVDLERAYRIYKGDDKAVREVLDVYLSSTQSTITQIKQALEAKNAKLVTRLAHDIKGASAYLAAQEMFHLARVLEAAAKAENWGVVAERFEELEPAFIRVWAYVNRLEVAKDPADAAKGASETARA